jgi:hypothetical protein
VLGPLLLARCDGQLHSEERLPSHLETEQREFLIAASPYQPSIPGSFFFVFLHDGRFPVLFSDDHRHLLATRILVVFTPVAFKENSESRIAAAGQIDTVDVIVRVGFAYRSVNSSTPIPAS